MNTKSSALVGWLSYTAAFAVGYFVFFNGSGGRKEKIAEADRLLKEREEREKIEEDRIRAQRAALKQHKILEVSPPSSSPPGDAK